MDTQKYIASGILENYVLGLVSEGERQEVMSYAQQYPEIQQELTAIENVLGLYTQAQARPMPKDLDAQILKHIEQLSSTTPPSKQPLPTASREDDTLKPTTPKDSKDGSGGWLKGLLGLLAFLSLGAATFFYQQTDELKEDLTQKNQQLLNQQLACDNTKKELENQLSILRNHAFRSILLEGTDKAPGVFAAIYYNEADNMTYFDVRNMPKPTADKQYQLWAIVDGAPVDMGVFNLPIDSVDFVEVPYIANAQAFAVTLEIKGGNPTPNLEELYVYGDT